MKKHPLGLVSISFRAHTPEEILSAMKDAGLTHIEWGSDVHAPKEDIDALFSLAALTAEYGITVSSYGTYFFLGETPLSELPDYINAAKALGTDILRLWCGKKSGASMTEEEKTAFIAECKRAASIAEEMGVTLCMECHRNSFTERLEDSLLLMREVNSPAFEMYYQPHQWKSVEENIEMAEKLSPFTHIIHAFQWKGSERFSLWEGIDEWSGYLSHFEGQPLLLEFMPDDRIESLKTEAEALKRLIGGKA